MNCAHARPLVPLYLDGELTPSQSAELRPHLLECAECRSHAQAEQAMHAWFTPTEEVPVPEGFAARVARRAVAGDPGTEPITAPAAARNERRSSEPILHFVLQALAVAAVALMVISIAMRRLEQPAAEDLKAHGSQALDASLLALDQLNRAELPGESDRDGDSSR